MAHSQSDYGNARAHFDASLALYREADNQHGVASVLNALGWIDYFEDDIVKAATLFEESLAIYRALDAKLGIARSLGSLGRIKETEGDYVTARALYEEGLAMYPNSDETRLTFDEAIAVLSWNVHYEKGFLLHDYGQLPDHVIDCRAHPRYRCRLYDFHWPDARKACKPVRRSRLYCWDRSTSSGNNPWVVCGHAYQRLGVPSAQVSWRCIPVLPCLRDVARQDQTRPLKSLMPGCSQSIL